MKAYVVAVFDSVEIDILKRVLPSLPIAYHDDWKDNAEARAVRALAGRTDATYELLDRARTALKLLVDTCNRERQPDYWTRTLSTIGEEITPDTPGAGIIARPYEVCRYLAEARSVQWREARDALTLVKTALGFVTGPRPDTKYDDA